MFVIIFGFCFVGGRDLKLGREHKGQVGGEEWKQQSLFIRIWTHKYIGKKKKGHKFKREQGGLLYGQVYWDKREEKNSVIIISKMKKNLKF